MKKEEQTESFATGIVMMSPETMGLLDELYNGAGPSEELLKRLGKSLSKDSETNKLV